MDTGNGTLSDAEMAVMVARACSAVEARAHYAELVPALVLLQYLGPRARGLVTAEPVLNVRARPALGSSVVGQFATDQVILLYGQSADGDWLAVGPQPAGWVAAAYVKVMHE